MITLLEQLNQAGVVIHTNKGTSMMPLLRENRDLMVIGQKGAGVLRKYDAVLFIRPNGEYVMHRILRIDSDGYWIVGDNCISGEKVKEEQIVGVLTEIVRDGKTIKVTDRGYQIFVRVWVALFPLRSLRLRAVEQIKSVAGAVKRRLDP